MTQTQTTVRPAFRLARRIVAPGGGPRRNRLRAGVLVVVAALALLGAPAAAQTREAIHDYDVNILIEDDGDLLITEVIEYDFGSNQLNGILRDIPLRLYYDDTYDRVYDLDVIEVTTSTDASDHYEVEDAGGGIKRIRIGDADRTITGAHTYTIQYRVEDALNGFESHDELYWNAIGAQWAVPIGASTVTVTAPAGIERVACFAGPTGSSAPCDSSGRNGTVATFRQDGLSPYQNFTIVVALPKGAVPEPRPNLDERWSLQRAFTASPLTLGVGAGLLAAIGGAIARLVWKSGRDRQYAGSAVNVAFGNPEGGEEQRVALFADQLYPLEYVPPDDLKPAEIGVLVDEIAHPLDVTATIVDLAAHGYLRIEEVRSGGVMGMFEKDDWKLIRTEKAGGLKEFEQLLINGLFSSGDEVLLSSLKATFVERLKRVQDALYDAVVAHGWFSGSPKATRDRWLGIGFGVLIAGGAILAAAIAWTHVAWMAVPLPIAGIALIALHGAMPHRTAKGTAALTRVRGFRRFIETAETERARFAENANLFYDYLPYAIVFGATEKWAKAFEGLDNQPENPGWYVSSRPFAIASFSDSMNSFTTTGTGTIASTPGGSGSSGFSGGSSGGGGGGGGGGSW